MKERKRRYRVWTGDEMIYTTDHSLIHALMTMEPPGGNECVLMDWVGLDSAEEQGIYEGDVVEHLSSGEREEVAFSHASIWPFRSNAGDEWRPDECRVVGNVFENPELKQQADD